MTELMVSWFKSEDDGSGPSVGLPRKEESTSVNIRPAACTLDTYLGWYVAWIL